MIDQDTMRALLLFEVPVLTLIFSIFLHFHTQRSSYFRERRLNAVDPSPRQISNELKNSVFCRATDIAAFALAGRLFVFHADCSWSWPEALFTFAFSLLVFDAWFYGVHRLLHLPSFRLLHGIHHRWSVTTPLTAFSSSPLEHFFLVDLGLILPATLLSSLGRLSFFAYWIFLNAVGFYTIFIHSNLGLFGVSRARKFLHLYHHENGDVNYALIFPLLDRVFGTAFKWTSAELTISNLGSKPGQKQRVELSDKQSKEI